MNGKNVNKKKYATKAPDYISIAYHLLFYSIAIFLLIRLFTNKQFALPFLFLIPFVIGIFIFYILLPLRLINFVIGHIFIYLYTRTIKNNVPLKTVIIIGKINYKDPNFWFSPSFDLDLVYLIIYLKIKKEEFSVYRDTTLTELDEIMLNQNIKTIYLVGHGRRHGFSVDKELVVDYCRYQDTKYSKEHVYQIHCNGGGGKSLVEYVVHTKNQSTYAPEHGLFSNLGFIEMFIDKIIEHRNLNKFNSFLLKCWYWILAIIIPALSFLIYLSAINKIVL